MNLEDSTGTVFKYKGLFTWRWGDPVSRVTRLGGQPASSYRLLFFLALRLHDRWGGLPRWVARSALSGNPPSRGRFLPCKWLMVG